MKNRKKNSGQAYVEYLVGGLVLMVALLAPMPEAIAPGDANGMSAAEYLIEQVKRNHEGYIWAMSVPVN